MKILLTMVPDDNELLDLGIYEIAPMPCLALYTLAGRLRSRGLDVSVLDGKAQQIEISDLGFMPSDSDVPVIQESQAEWESFSEKVHFISLNEAAQQFDVMGFSVNSFNWKTTRLAIEQVKREHPNLIIVVGGIHPTWLYEHLLATTAIDYVVRGEGEIVFPELLRRLCDGIDVSSVEGLAYRSGSKGIVAKDFRPLEPDILGEEGLPAFDLLPKKCYAWIPLETSRGCTYSCKFCSIMHKRRWRPLPLGCVEKLIDHTIQYCNRLLPTMDDYSNIYIVDDTFTLDQERSATILEMLSPYQNRIRISLEARANDLLNPVFFNRFKPFRVGILQVGADSGYGLGLRKISKGASIRTIRDCAALAFKLDMSERTCFSFIIGYPWEGVDECIQTLNFAFDLSSQFGVRSSIKWLFPLPGSSIWEKRRKWGIEIGPKFFDSFGLGVLDFFEKIQVRLKQRDYFKLKDYFQHRSGLRKSLGAPGEVVLKKLVHFTPSSNRETTVLGRPLLDG